MTTFFQPEFFPATPPDPNQGWLEQWLEENSGWHTAPEICAASGDRLSERQIRALVSTSRRVISGSRGYRHLHRATPDEIRHFIADMKSRARELLRRVVTIRREAHKIIG